MIRRVIKRFTRRIAGWFYRVHDRVVCFVRGHTPRRRTNYTYCAACGYLHQKED